VDLHLIPGAVPTADEQAAVDAAIGTAPYGPPSQHNARRHRLLEALHAVQSRVGWISEGAINCIA